jgi:hypothetical protein
MVLIVNHVTINITNRKFRFLKIGLNGGLSSIPGWPKVEVILDGRCKIASGAQWSP